MVIAGEVARMVARGWADLAVAVLALAVELFEGILVRFAVYSRRNLYATLTKGWMERCLLCLLCSLWIVMTESGRPNGSNLAGVFLVSNKRVRRSSSGKEVLV